MTPDVKMTLQRLSRTRSLATRQVFTYKGRPLQRVNRSFKTALVEAGITEISGFMTCATVPLLLSEEQGWVRPPL
jgi:hypothetical protein